MDRILLAKFFQAISKVFKFNPVFYIQLISFNYPCLEVKKVLFPLKNKTLGWIIFFPFSKKCDRHVQQLILVIHQVLFFLPFIFLLH